MKKFLSLILVILGIGFLISCVGKINLDKPISNDNKTTVDNSTDNDVELDPGVQLYSHNIRIYYDPDSYPDYLNYTEQIETFDFSFNLISESSQPISFYNQLYEVYSNCDFVSIDSFDGTIICNSVEYNVTGIEFYEVGIAVLVNNTNVQINLDSLDHSYYISDSVSLYE